MKTILSLAIATAVAIACFSPAESAAQPRPMTAKPDAKRTAQTPVAFQQCVVGMWAQTRRSLGIASIELHYPRSSTRSYRMHYYMWTFPLHVTAKTSVQFKKLANSKQRAWIGRNNDNEMWQLTSAAMCPQSS